MLSRLLREILFNLVHLVLTVLVAIQAVYRRFWTNNPYFRGNFSIRSDIQLILKHVPRLQKKLHHLVIVTYESHSVTDLARVVIWSLAAGIPYVSFYDATGELTEHEEKLFLEVEKFKVGVPGCIKWSRKPDLNGYSNGSQAHTIIVNIFKNEDGRATIMRCIRGIAEGSIPCERRGQEFTTQELDATLSHFYPSIPDPELALCSGPVCQTYGLLPWQIRLTEFIQLPVNDNLNVQSYLGALNKYNKCDQRFGK